MRRSLLAEVDLGAIRHNFDEIRRATGALPLIAVVKADAYGHGAPEVGRTLEKAGAFALAVAYVNEALELREAGIKCPILVMFELPDISACLEHSLTPVITSIEKAEAIDGQAAERNIRVDVHLKVDTGMGRMGLVADEEILRVAGMKNITISGLMSHFSEADLAGPDYARKQISEFLRVRDMLSRRGLRPLCHMANSAASIALPESRMDAVRPGLALYGISPFDENARGVSLRPAMTVKARVLDVKTLRKGSAVSYGRTFVTVRDTRAAVVAAGYADGFFRSLSNNSYVILNGGRAPVMGRVCMDLIVVDATDMENVNSGDEAVVLGRQGDMEITAWDLARNASTIPYEVLTSLGGAARISYVRDGREI